MNYIILTLFGISPSIVWLFYYLRKDVHPESNRMILKIFFYGMLMAPVAALIEIGIDKGLNLLKLPFFLLVVLDIFIGVALVEEWLKYFVVKFAVLRHPELDEPIDIMLYMIISALGFVAVENILLLFSFKNFIQFSQTVGLTSGRFISATLLHALTSATIGYFLALSIFESKKRKRFIFAGLVIAVVLHGFYNFFIMLTRGPSKVVMPIIILISLALFVSLGMRKLKKIKGVCKI